MHLRNHSTKRIEPVTCAHYACVVIYKSVTHCFCCVVNSNEQVSDIVHQFMNCAFQWFNFHQSVLFAVYDNGPGRIHKLLCMAVTNSSLSKWSVIAPRADQTKQMKIDLCDHCIQTTHLWKAQLQIFWWKIICVWALKWNISVKNNENEWMSGVQCIKACTTWHQSANTILDWRESCVNWRQSTVPGRKLVLNVVTQQIYLKYM